MTALSDERVHILSAFLLTGADAPGWKLSDSRRYLNLAELRQLADDDGHADSRIAGLEGSGALVRGLVLKCARCRGKQFYRLADVGDEFRCSRCRLDQALKAESWMVGIEPPWRYGLGEVIFQFLANNGDLPLLAGHDFMRAGAEDRPLGDRRQLQYTGELDIFDADGVKHELDILLADGARLWIGEATTKRRLEPTNEDEQERLQRFRATADVLCARGALLITSTTWEHVHSRAVRVSRHLAEA